MSPLGMAVLFYRAANTCMLLAAAGRDAWRPMALTLLQLGLEMLLTSLCLLRTVRHAIAR